MKKIMYSIVTGLLSVVASAGVAQAQTCEPPQLSPQTSIDSAVWQDTARFSFLVGRDNIGSAINMTLVRRLTPFPSFTELRQLASRWDTLYRQNRAIAAEIASMDHIVRELSQLCQELDNAFWEETPLNEANWLNRVNSIRSNLARTLANATALENQMSEHARLLEATANYYTQQSYTDNTYADIGPNPATVSNHTQDIAILWRAIVQDLEFTHSLIPTAINVQDETGNVIDLASAARSMGLVLERTTALSKNFVDISDTINGNYLYEQCPIEENVWLTLENNWYRDINGVLTLSGDTIVVAPRSQRNPNQQWKFTKVGNGYWKISNRAISSTSNNLLLDVLNSTAAYFQLELTASNQGRPQYTGQFWRCYPTAWPGLYRLSNSFIGEERSIDTYNNSPQAIMSETGNFSGQLWQFNPAN